MKTKGNSARNEKEECVVEKEENTSDKENEILSFLKYIYSRYTPYFSFT